MICSTCLSSIFSSVLSCILSSTIADQARGRVTQRKVQLLPVDNQGLEALQMPVGQGPRAWQLLVGQGARALQLPVGQGGPGPSCRSAAGSPGGQGPGSGRSARLSQVGEFSGRQGLTAIFSYRWHFLGSSITEKGHF